MRKKHLILPLILVIFVLVLGGCFNPPAADTPQSQLGSTSNPIKYFEAKVTRVTDGDTIHVSLNGRDETVRLTGIDTPETVKPNAPVQPGGKEASDFTKTQLTGKTVYLELDVGERDKYGRLLAYVWISPPTDQSDNEIRNKMFNARLLLEGYARLMTVPPNVKYADYFAKYQQEAREKRTGLWGL